MAINWTAVPANLKYGFTGSVEYRIENDGLVRWRGEALTTVAGLGVGGENAQLSIPGIAAPVRPAIYVNWSGLAADRNIIVQVQQMLLGYFSPSGSVINLNDVSYQGTVPPGAADHSLESVQAGLADALRTIVGLRVYDFPSDRIEPPAAVLSLPETPYDVTFGGRTDEWTFPLWVLVAKADDKASYGEMLGYLEAEGSKSIRAAIEADRTLGGACDTCAVTRARPLFATVAGTEFLAVEFTLEVYS
jgi:hypothetical protein